MPFGRHSRRRFLSHVGGLGAAAATSLAFPRGASAQIDKAVLTSADFTPLGGFRIPDLAFGRATAWGNCLAHRYVDGQLRLFSTVFDFPQGGLWNVFEMTPPASLASFQDATLVRDWGNIYQGKRHLDQYGSGDTGWVYGLYWDPLDERLYWSYGDTYNSRNGNDCCVGYSTLNDSTGTATAVGAWRFTNEKASRGGVTAIPQWFANAYLGGKRLGAGFGGYFSVITVGPGSMGPALTAFSPPQIATNPHTSQLAEQRILGYPFNATPYTIPTRQQRDTDYNTSFDGWQPNMGIGYWTWVDILWQSGVWIDLPNKHGLLYGAVMGNGNVFYQTSTTHAQRGSHHFLVYNPADLAAVAQGNGNPAPHQIQAHARWPVQFQGLTYPLAGWSDDARCIINGMTFDALTNRLYVMVRFSESNGKRIFVFQVNDTTVTPSPPTNVRIV